MLFHKNLKIDFHNDIYHAFLILTTTFVSIFSSYLSYYIISKIV